MSAAALKLQVDLEFWWCEVWWCKVLQSWIDCAGGEGFNGCHVTMTNVRQPPFVHAEIPDHFYQIVCSLRPENCMQLSDHVRAETHESLLSLFCICLSPEYRQVHQFMPVQRKKHDI